MPKYALVPLALLALYLAYRFLLPALTTRASVFTSSSQAVKERTRLESLIPPAARHATYGEAYLTEDLDAVQRGTVLTDYEPELTLLIASGPDFLILNQGGEALLTAPLTSLVMGLPEGYDAMGEDRYFYFILLDSNLALSVRVYSILKSAGIGDDELGRWDALLS